LAHEEEEEEEEEEEDYTSHIGNYATLGT
jgi:hypothetical protein